jgi:hypothetical protein
MLNLITRLELKIYYKNGVLSYIEMNEEMGKTIERLIYSLYPALYIMMVHNGDDDDNNYNSTSTETGFHSQHRQ